MVKQAAISDLTIRDMQARLSGLLIFECVARHKNFARAADDFMVTPTAISKSIKQLEEQMGVRLFNRTTRSTALTEAGQMVYDTLKPALAQIKLSLESVSDTTDSPAGLLRLNSSYVAYATLIEPHLASFLAKYPDITFEVSLDNSLADIVGRGFDAGIRLGHALQKDMVSVRLGPIQTLVAVASPDYIAEHGKPTQPSDLLTHRCIRQRFASGAKFLEWEFLIAGKPVVIDVKGPMVVDEMRLAANAARNGIGIAYVFQQFVAADIASGNLVVLIKKYNPPRDMFHIYYPSGRQLPGKLRVFIDHIRAANWAMPK